VRASRYLAARFSSSAPTTARLKNPNARRHPGTAGTTMSDYMDRTLGLGFGTKGSSLILLGLLVALAVYATI